MRHTNGTDASERFYVQDGLGSTKALVNSAGLSPTGIGYDNAWGDPAGTATGHLFNGQRYDNGLYYLRARFYDPALGVFLTQDPLLGSAESPVTLQRYLYAGNDPVNHIDPSGQDFSLGGMMVSTSIANSLRSISSSVEIGVGQRIQDLLLYGPQQTTEYMIRDAVTDAVVIATGVGFIGALALNAINDLDVDRPRQLYSKPELGGSVVYRGGLKSHEVAWAEQVGQMEKTVVYGAETPNQVGYDARLDSKITGRYIELKSTSESSPQGVISEVRESLKKPRPTNDAFLYYDAPGIGVEELAKYRSRYGSSEGKTLSEILRGGSLKAVTVRCRNKVWVTFPRF